MWHGLIEAYREFLPVSDQTPVITLNEGNTPLIRADRISQAAGDVQIYLKYDGLNPTGSFKDRGMTMAVSKALESGARAIMCASTGNTSASAAAYAARAGVRCVVLIPSGKIALGKLAQAITYGAEVYAIDGNFDQALLLARDLTARHPIVLVNSVNPFRIEGQKTAAFEVCGQLGEAPDYLAIPVGNAGNITAYWQGFRECRAAGRSHILPRMTGFQASGAAPIVENRVVEHPETLATAIRIGNPASWQKAVKAITESDGSISAVTDAEIIEAYQLLASAEGVFAEPASAASVAGVLKLARKGQFAPGSRIVCVLTGNGLKDPDTAIKVGKPPVTLPAEARAIEATIL